MHLGPDTSGSTARQQPTYYLAPNFTTRPSPDGHLDLGTIVEDIKDFYPITAVTERVPIPEGERYYDVKENVSNSFESSRSVEASVLARVLDRSIGGEMSFKRQRTGKEIYEIRKLETIYFHPQRSYINKCMRLSSVEDYIGGGNGQVPVYLITGLKIAWGATVSIESGRGKEASVGAGVSVPVLPVDVDVSANVGAARESTVSSSFGEPADFVLGIQVQKIYHKKKLWSGERTLVVERAFKGAVLVDDDEVAEADDDEAGDNFVMVDMGNEELEYLVPWVGQDSEGRDEAWFIPSGVSVS
ncbi:uncharacterized protein DNG_01668 [Cephalotrichum gorgonifer]|uniref:Uncharacterized protein n=1 Tax=Cephalotrichum gorgonifer TaxID=2041049 RepID=A0AAE8MTH1_9PEZI|nr:uncharacterized protein DNG_01668 [Cephalotrichum gorgonifer]